MKWKILCQFSYFNKQENWQKNFFQVNLVHSLQTINSQSLPWLIRFWRNLNTRLGCLISDDICRCATMHKINGFIINCHLHTLSVPKVRTTYISFFGEWLFSWQASILFKNMKSDIFHFIDTLKYVLQSRWTKMSNDFEFGSDINSLWLTVFVQIVCLPFYYRFWQYTNLFTFQLLIL